MKKPLVSVIIPSYNHEAYVRQAAESVLESSIKDIELIVVDDGSTDNSVAIIQGIKDSRVRLICQENKGTAIAIHRGVSIAHSPWIAILNSDDVFHPHKIETHLDVHNKNKALEASACRVRIITTEGIPFDKNHSYVQSYIRSQDTCFRFKSIFRSLLVLNHILTTSALFIKKDVFFEIGGFVPLRYTHDWFMFLTLAARGQFHIIEEQLLDYRRHEANTLLQDRDMVDLEANFLIEWHLFQEFLKPNPAVDIITAFHLLEENRYVYFEMLSFFQCWRLISNNQLDRAGRILGDTNHKVFQQARRILEVEKEKRICVDKLESKVDVLETRVENRDKQIKRIKNTISWRITAPLRSDKIKNGLDKIKTKTPILKSLYKSLLKKAHPKPSRFNSVKEILKWQNRGNECSYLITHECPSRCRHCDFWREKETKARVSDSSIENLFLALRAENFSAINLTGGDPLAHREFFEIADLCANIGFSFISVNTTGLLLSGKRLERFKQAPVNHVVFSLDGSREVHDWLRGIPGAHDKVLFSLNALKNYKSLQISFVIMDANYDQIPYVAEVARNFGCKLTCQPFDLTLSNSSKNCDLLLTDKKKIAILEKDLLRLKNDPVYENILSPSILHINKIVQYIKDPSAVTTPCVVGYWRTHVEPNGDVFACYPLGKLGNAFDTDFRKIWNGKPYMTIRDRMLRRDCPNCLLNCYTTVNEQVAVWTKKLLLEKNEDSFS